MQGVFEGAEQDWLRSFFTNWAWNPGQVDRLSPPCLGRLHAHAQPAWNEHELQRKTRAIGHIIHTIEKAASVDQHCRQKERVEHGRGSARQARGTLKA